MYACMYVCMYVCMYISIHPSIHASIHPFTSPICVSAANSCPKVDVVVDSRDFVFSTAITFSLAVSASFQLSISKLNAVALLSTCARPARVQGVGFSPSVHLQMQVKDPPRRGRAIWLLYSTCSCRGGYRYHTLSITVIFTGIIIVINPLS